MLTMTNFFHNRDANPNYRLETDRKKRPSAQPCVRRQRRDVYEATWHAHCHHRVSTDSGRCVARERCCRPAKLTQGAARWNVDLRLKHRTQADGSKTDRPDLKGIVIYTSDGHFAFVSVRADLPKLANPDRERATAEEARAVVAGSIAYYGI